MGKCKKKVCKKIDKPFFENLDNTLNDVDFSVVDGGRAQMISKITKSNTDDFDNFTGFKVVAPSDRKIIIEGVATFKNLFKKASNKVSQIGKKKEVQNSVQQQLQAEVQESQESNQPYAKGFAVNENETATIWGPKDKQIQNVFVPRDRHLTVQGVNKFILGNCPEYDFVKNISYYKCEKLEEMVFIFNNNSAIDFNLELFNTSMPLDYLYSTSLNLNDKVTVAGGAVSYSDVLFNLLANPAMIVNAKFTFSAPDSKVANLLDEQINIPLIFKNKRVTGEEKIAPLNIALQYDTMQYAKDIVFFNIMEMLNRPFIPDGMDVIQYKVLAGFTVTMAFFFKQHSLKKFFFEEAKLNKEIM